MTNTSRVLLLGLAPLTLAFLAACGEAIAPQPGTPGEEPPAPPPPVVTPKTAATVHHLRWSESGGPSQVAPSLGQSQQPPVTELYLAGTGVPRGSLAQSAPSASVLPNYDPGRDAFPGLLLQATDNGLMESDPVKYQKWVGGPSPIDVDGPVSLVLWSAMQDFDQDDNGVVHAGLFECDAGGSNCDPIVQATLKLDPWSGSSSWVERTIDFGPVTRSVPPGRVLAVKIVVEENDMWFAYGTTAQPSRLAFSGPKPVPYEVSVWAVRGEQRSVDINNQATGNPFLQLDVFDPVQLSDGTPIGVGDSVMLTVTVDPEKLVVSLEPSGITFGQEPTQLRMWYSDADPDFNGDGVVDDEDVRIENDLLEVWYQEVAGAPWETIVAIKSAEDGSFTAVLDHFSNYAVAW